MGFKQHILGETEDILQTEWNQKTPKERIKLFRIKNSPFVYANWKDLSDKEKDTIRNAYRIITTIKEK